MKIHSIANAPTFGYNKQLNLEVNRKLEATEKNPKKSKASREMARDLRMMNLECMRLEDKLRNAERTRNLPAMKFYQDLFVTTKFNLAEVIDKRFPNLDYINKEALEYSQEMTEKQITNVNHWLPQTARALTDIIAGKILEEVDMEELKKRGTAQQTQPPAASAEVPAKKPDANDNPLVELFIPNEFSPAGFQSIGAMQDVKEELYDKIIYPIRNPEQAELDRIEYGKRFPRGIMFYGPSGCGKTYLMEAVALEAGIPLYKLKVSKIGSTLVNGSAKQMQEGYEIVKKKAAETGRPVLMMMDEMEGLTAKRDETGRHAEANKLIGTLLQIMDEARGDNVIILASTNHINLIDPAIRNRIDNTFYFGLPDDETRDKILKIALNRFSRGSKLANNDIERAKIVKATKGFAIRDLMTFTDKASDIARRDGRRDIKASDFDEPIAKNQDRKVNENLYKDQKAAKIVGFGTY